MRALIYDRTCVTDRGRLSPIWAMGARLYQRLGRIDLARGVASWSEAVAWLAEQRDPIDEIQYWGHGKWGCALIDGHELDATSLEVLEPVRRRLAAEALVWFRTCETFGTTRGIHFAESLSDFLGARVAGHTYVIGFHQSGLHGLRPGRRADWSAEEGLAAGTAAVPERAKRSAPWAPRTITCLGGEVPIGWFA